MSEYVIVRINEQLIPNFQINYNSTTKIASKSNVSSWESIKQNRGEKLIVLISANNVYTTVVNIPSKNEEVIRQSIPFAIEEELASDIGENHCGYLKLSEQNFLVSVIAKNLIEQTQQQLQTHGLNCDEMYSEIFSCPQHDDYLTLCALDNYFIIRDGYKGTIIKKDLIGFYLTRSESKQQVVFSDKEIDLQDYNNIILKITDTVLLQAQSITNGKAVNLFQGEYNQDIKAKKHTNPLKKNVIILLLLISSWLVINLSQLWKLNSEIDLVKSAQKTLLISLTPNVSQTELNDPYSAILSMLQINQNNKNKKNNTGFISALGYIGQTLKQNPTIQIQSFRQRDTKLEVNLKAQNVTQLNLFQQNLEKNAYSMRVKSGTRDSVQDGIVSVLTMEQL